LALELHITKRAAGELNRIAEWWGANRTAAPGAVREDLQAALALLLEQPGLGATVAEASSPVCGAFTSTAFGTGCTTAFAATGSKSYRCGTQVAAPVPRCEGMTPNPSVNRTCLRLAGYFERWAP
jgi:hypothetical protein